MVEGEGKKESEEDKIKKDKPDQQLIIFQANKIFTRYINGHPKRHFLTTGWNAFATAKRLLANDSFVFLRGEDGELRVGVRRVSHQQNIMPASVISPQNMHLGVLATVFEALSRNSIFVVHYKPWEEELCILLATLENQPKKDPSRRSYIQRITEITKNSRKQDADIEHILKDTRELQLESNFIHERLDRTYAVVDETLSREGKKDPVGRQAYSLLRVIHESFEQISNNILATDRVGREAVEYEAKLSALSRRSFDVDKLKADLDAIRIENDFLEQHDVNDDNSKNFAI